MNRWEIARSVAGVRHLIEEAEERGVGPSEGLAGTGIDAASLGDASATVAPWQEVAVAQNIAMALPSTAGLGLALARRRTITTYGPAGLAMLSAATVRDALSIAGGQPSFTLALSRTTLADEAGLTSAYFDGGRIPTDVRRLLVERDVASALLILRFVTGRQPRLRRLDLAFPVDGTARQWLRVAGTAPRFDARVTRAVVDTDVLDERPVGADPQTWRLALDQVARVIDERQVRATVRSQVLEVVRHNAPNVPTLNEVASALLTTSRTLRRRLRAEGTSLREVVGQVRFAAASGMLAGGVLSVQQIAGRLGYSDTAAFTRAFRSWSGVSPTAYKRRVDAGTGSPQRGHGLGGHDPSSA